MPPTHLPYQGHTRSTRQNPQAKSPGFNNLPQSKRPLREPLRMQPLATVPTLGVGPPQCPCSSRYFSALRHAHECIIHECHGAIHVRDATDPFSITLSRSEPEHA